MLGELGLGGGWLERCGLVVVEGIPWVLLLLVLLPGSWALRWQWRLECRSRRRGEIREPVSCGIWVRVKRVINMVE